MMEMNSSYDENAEQQMKFGLFLDQYQTEPDLLIPSIISLQHSGLSLSSILKCETEGNDKFFFNKEKEYLDIIKCLQCKSGISSIDNVVNSNLSETFTDLQKYLMKFIPKNFKQYLWYLEKAVICLMSTTNNKCTIHQKELNWCIISRSLNMASTWKAKPEYLHVICERVFNVLENDKNRIYFVEKISSIIKSSISIILSHLLAWGTLYNVANFNIKMFRLYSFSHLIYILNNKIDLNSIKENQLKLYRLLEIVSVLYHLYNSKLHTRVNGFQREFDLNEYFEYDMNDSQHLHQWCSNLSNSINITENIEEKFDFNENTTLIKEILDLDILFFLEMDRNESQIL